MNFFCTLRKSCLALLLLLAATAVTAHSQLNVTTYKYNEARTGANTRETVLTPESLTRDNFHKLFTTPLDGYVYAQPLVMSGLRGVAGGAWGKAYNVVFAATEHDSIYALDADSANPAGTVLWHRNYLEAGETTISAAANSTSTDLNCGDLVPEIGITGTPVIDDRDGTMYFVATARQRDKTFVQRLHAVSLLDGSERFGSPVVITGQMPGSPYKFDPLNQMNRAALLLNDGKVIIGWASHCGTLPYHGWMMAYDARTLRQLAAFNTTPNDLNGEGGIWMSGDGIAADEQHRIFFATANGIYDPAHQAWGDTIMRMDPKLDGDFKIGDWFTPWDQNLYYNADWDQGAGGLLLLPELPAGKPHRHLLVQMAKIGTMYLIDRDNMGKYCDGCTTDSQIVQSIPQALEGGWATPAYWNGFLYFVSGHPLTYIGGDLFKAWKFDTLNGTISTAPVSQAARIFESFTTAPVVSADGDKNGIVWLLENGGTNTTPLPHQTLYAYDATDLTKLLYTSEQAAGGRDRPGGSVTFAAPVVVNGKVFAGASGSLSAWGLNNVDTNCESRSEWPCNPPPGPLH